MRPFLLSVASVALMVLPASACINDRESIKAEKEFKSQYEAQPAAPALSEPVPAPHELVTYGAFGGGVLLLVGAFALGIVKTRS